MSEEIQKPSIGRIVLIANAGRRNDPEVPAIVTAVGPGFLVVDLVAFAALRNTTSRGFTGVPYSDPPGQWQLGDECQTWRWPPRVPS